MSEFFAISLVIILAAISPGPDFAIVTKNALLYSRKAGIFTALGVSISLLIHASYCILGLAVIIAKSLLLFSLIKYLGATYLIYIGIKSLCTKRSLKETPIQRATVTMTALQSFRQGFCCVIY